MKQIVGFILISIASVKAERDWSKIFPKHLPIPPTISLPQPENIPSTRITGGEEAEPHSIPSQVALFIPVEDGRAFCGGSLISSRTVLTAAHCVDEATGPIEVVLGAHRITEFESTQVSLSTSAINIHPRWSSLTRQNDVALLRLPQAVQFNDYIQPIPLASDVNNTFEGHEATASGWGLESDESTTIAPALRKVVVPVITNDVCGIPYLGIIQPSHICASGLGGKSTCSGDSGGPLTVGGTLIGITSFGIIFGCEVGWPSVYGRVSYFYDWIKSNLD